jgi:hypothetical protein
VENLAELLARLENLTDLDDADLAALETELAEALDAILDGPLDDQTLADAEAVTAGVETVRAETAARADAATERQARADALRDRVRAEPEGDEGETAEGEPPAEGETEGPELPAEEAEPIAAASRRIVARVGRVAARRQATPPPAGTTTPPLTFPEWGLTAAANAPGVTAGAPVNDYDQLGAIFFNAWRTITGPTVGPRANVPLVRAGRGPVGEYGEHRTLDGHAPSNAAKIRDVVHPSVITASGGMCAPINIAYDLPVVGSSARPVRDQALARFGADRGGIRTLIPPVLGDVTGALGVWTNDDDIAGTGTKPCLTVDCPDETETLVEALTQCLKMGNFRQRFFPEQVEAVMKLIAVAGARAGEIKALQDMKANATAVTTARLLGTTRDVLAYLDQAVAGYRDRWRLDDSERLRLVLPRWAREAMRADMARSLPGTSDENLVIADATIAGWFASRSVNVTWAMEASSAAGFMGAQAAGALVKFPATIEAFLYPEGAFLFLDGGSLDLGLIRDSTLTATNDLMFFSETFEAIHFQGPEAICLTMTTCPDGTVSGTADIDPCA